MMMLRCLIYCIAFFSPLAVLAQGPNTPLEFIENKGQWDDGYLYHAGKGNINIYLDKTSIMYSIDDAQNANKIKEYRHGGTNTKPILKFHNYRVSFVGANKNPSITGSKAQEHYYNYFLGNDSSKWKTNIHPNLNVDYTELYKHINLHIASANHSIKYDLIVKPGGNPDEIKLYIDGADDITIKKGKLHIHTSVGEVIEDEPFAYQYINGERVEVKCKYNLEGKTITYKFPQGYNTTTNLIIDPNVEFSTYTGSSANNWGYSATYDNQGNFYAGGAVDARNGAYITTTGAFQTTYQGGGIVGDTVFQTDMAITKFNATGSALIYSTYLGGNDNDQPHSMIVDANGNLIIAGRTYSNNFPMGGSPYDNSHNLNADIIVAKLNASGTGLIGSTYIGGSNDDGINISANYSVVGTSLKHSYGDEARSEVIVDVQGNIYVAACTRSGNFPTVNPIQNSLLGSQDAVVFKLNSTLSTLLWSTYLGGSGDDAAYVLGLSNNDGAVYVSGGTASNNFPFTTGTIWPSYQNGIDGFIAKFQNSGTYPLQRATAIGRNSYDQCYGIQVDKDNNVYAMGQTLGGTFPVSAGVFSIPNSSQFIIKVDSNLSNIIFSTVFGSGTSTSVNITPTAFLVDTCDNIYVSGWGGNIVPGNASNTTGMPIPTSNPATTPSNILKFNSTNGNDFYFIVLSRNAATQLYGAYYGLDGTNEHVDGGTSRFDKNGVIYQAICGGCGLTTPQPTTAGSWRTSKGSTVAGDCNLLALKIAFNLGSVVAHAKASPDSTICLGESISFQNTSSNATNYEWDFGDGTPVVTLNSPSHTYTSAGTFTVRMIAINPNACKIRDTVTLQIVVDTNNIKADFTLTTIDSCGPYTAAVANTSKFGSNPSAATFTWTFGDGTSFTGATPPQHTFPNTGTYTITLKMDDATACNSPDSISKTVTFDNTLVKALWEVPNLLCESVDATFSNRSENGTTYYWDFGDGDTSTLHSPVHRYDTGGTYTIKFYVYNPLSCNKVDSLQSTITIRANPTADFTHAPIIPETNEPITFTNTSVGADTYNWNFGDGTGSMDKDPPPHLYKKTGNYTVCLTAITREGCEDTKCKPVEADIYPLANLPTAFSPNGDGSNDVLYVRGSGIDSMTLLIYNRWGEVIFETTDQEIGWDGKYNGKEQPMEAYAFVLNVTFIDGTTFFKKGNVTLLR